MLRAAISAVAILAIVTTCSPELRRTVVQADPPAEAGALAPELTRTADGVLLSWIEPVDGGGNRVRVGRLTESGWGSPVTVVEGTDLFVNWADFPSAIAGPDGSMLAHWLENDDRHRHSYGVRVARSTDGGASWTALGTPHRDDGAGEHGFVSIVRHPDGFRLFWLDGRHVDAATQIPRMELRTALVGDRIGPEEVVDPDVCTCCQTSAIALGSRSVVVYRDHEPSDEVRDIAIAQGGTGSWSAPRLVAEDGWEIAGCPVNGPSIDADGERAAVAWMTAPGGLSRVQVALSPDGGTTLGDAIVVDADAPIGRVDVACVPDGAAVLWLSRTGTVTLARIGTDGSVGTPVALDTTGTARSAGFPRMVRDGDRLVVAWRDTRDTPRICARIVPLESLPDPAAR